MAKVGGPPVPEVAHDAVVHVGALDPDRRASFSWEGDGLSVSVDPDAWVRIARLGGQPWWDVTRVDGAPLRFLDANALTDAQRAEIHDWAVDRSLVTRRTVWTVTWHDDEYDDDLETTYDSLTDAQADADDYGVPVAARTGLVPVDGVTVRGLALGNVDDVLLTLWADDHAPDLVGVWWADTLDVSRFSAPRGVILPTRIPQVQVTRH